MRKGRIQNTGTDYRRKRRPGLGITPPTPASPARIIPAVSLAIILAILAAGCMPPGPGSGGSVFPSLAPRGFPANPTSIELIVSAPDMETMSRTIDSGESSISLEVPAGAAREFSLTASNVSVTTSGSTVADLPAGAAVEISIPLHLRETRIVVPDAFNNRIVQIDDMTGTGWNTLLYSDIGLADWEFEPAEVDFDNSGRLYAALTGELQGVIVLDSIDASSYEMFVPGSVTEGTVDYYTKQVIAVDRNRDLLYIPAEADTDGNLVYELFVLAFSTDGGAGLQSAYDLSSDTGTLTLSDIFAMGVDSSGHLYLIGSPDGSVIYKLDLSQPAGSRVVDSVSFSDFNPADMMVKDDKLYVGGTYSVVAGGPIRRYDLDLNQEGSDITGKADATDPFFGVAAFLQHPGGGFLVADTDGEVSRLVAFDDFTTSGWSTFAPEDIGELFFLF